MSHDQLLFVVFDAVKQQQQKENKNNNNNYNKLKREANNFLFHENEMIIMMHAKYTI